MNNLSNLSSTFSQPLLRWFEKHGRKDLPWQRPAHDPYRIWISEIMLQQTQVKSVIPYFERFIKKFPSLELLAQSSEEEILTLWAGLGYYSRARNLHRTAQILWHEYRGIWPQEHNILSTLPGIGESTAAAITAQAFHQATPILDANVKRILSRYFMVDGAPGKSSVVKTLWQLAHSCMPQQRCADYTQAIMDLGATCCTTKNPQCTRCPVQAHCQALAHQCVDQFPKKIKRNPIPTRSQHFIIITHESAGIYLEKRASSGIWGGLWCLPAFDSESDIPGYLQENFQFLVSPDMLTSFMQMQHTFTHFHLQLQVWQVTTNPPLQTCPHSPNHGAWFTHQSIDNIGLPRPIQTITQCYFERRLPPSCL